MRVGGLTRLRMPAHHDVRAEDIDLRRLGKTLAAVADRGPQDFAELMLVPGVGARTLFALALVAEVVHGAPSRFADPARFSLAHGGKDGHPFPVPLNVYDQTIARAQARRRAREAGRGRAAGRDQAARRASAPDRRGGDDAGGLRSRRRRRMAIEGGPGRSDRRTIAVARRELRRCARTIAGARTPARVALD